MLSINNNISVGLVIYNDQSTVESCLASLEGQTHIKITEIIIVDNGGFDKSRNIVNNFARSYSGNITIISNSENNLGLARQKIVDQCKTEFLAFLDADCVAPVDWLSKFEENMNLFPNSDAWAAPNRMPSGSLYQKSLNVSLLNPLVHGYSAQTYIPKNSILVDHAPTTNSIFRVERVRNLGNFSEEFKSCCEDVDLGLRLSKTGNVTLLTAPIIKNYHSKNAIEWFMRVHKFSYYNSFIIKRSKPWVHGPSFLSKLVLIFIGLVLVLSYQSFFYIFGVYLLIMTAISLNNLKASLSFKTFFYVLLLTVGTHIFYGMGSLIGICKKIGRLISSLCCVFKLKGFSYQADLKSSAGDDVIA